VLLSVTVVGLSALVAFVRHGEGWRDGGERRG
jgi:hypothetical protein